jgi:hypothetical protein
METYLSGELANGISYCIRSIFCSKLNQRSPRSA